MKKNVPKTVMIILLIVVVVMIIIIRIEITDNNSTNSKNNKKRNHECAFNVLPGVCRFTRLVRRHQLSNNLSLQAFLYPVQ